ncbi:putative syntaxin-24 [Rutidosis leptorrhynchoides]|uniref:putative syntaxin-24 n=1 Tax=Rutidosis leptorrhynchoides TaxID=125765 RepID=UPI003A995939
MTFRNPYSKLVDIHFDKIDADLMYQGQRLGTKEVSGMFSLLPKNEKTIGNVVLRGQRVLQLINGDEYLEYASEKESGVYKIGVRVRIMFSSKAMLVNGFPLMIEVLFDNLEVPLNFVGEVSSAI